MPAPFVESVVQQTPDEVAGRGSVMRGAGAVRYDPMTATCSGCASRVRALLSSIRTAPLGRGGFSREAGGRRTVTRSSSGQQSVTLVAVRDAWRKVGADERCSDACGRRREGAPNCAQAAFPLDGHFDCVRTGASAKTPLGTGAVARDRRQMPSCPHPPWPPRTCMNVSVFLAAGGRGEEPTACARTLPQRH